MCVCMWGGVGGRRKRERECETEGEGGVAPGVSRVKVTTRGMKRDNNTAGRNTHTPWGVEGNVLNAN